MENLSQKTMQINWTRENELSIFSLNNIHSSNKKKEILIMKQNKFLSAVAVLLLIAFSTTSWVSPKPVAMKMPVTITVTTFGGMPVPGDNPGTFVATGAIETSGTSIMNVVPLSNVAIHCSILLTDEHGTITIHQECNFATPTPQGRWEIVSGTGDYANLRGNGPLTMPGNESMTGYIF